MPLRFLVFSLFLTAATLTAQDAVKVSPDYKVEIDNAWVRVLRAKYAPHEKVPMHEHPAYVVVMLTDEHLKITGADGKVRTVDRKAGESGLPSIIARSEARDYCGPYDRSSIQTARAHLDAPEQNN